MNAPEGRLESVADTIDPDALLDTSARFHEAVLRMTPQHRMAAPEELPGLALHLAPGASAFMTGAALPIDGGLLLGPPVNAGAPS